jgi:acetylglutamate kinase
MIPKLQNAFNALEAGVKQVIITKADEINKNSGTTIIL